MFTPGRVGDFVILCGWGAEFLGFQSGGVEMQHVDETQVFIRLVGDKMSFLCTVTDSEGNSSTEEFVEIKRKWDAFPQRWISRKGGTNATSLESYLSWMVSSISWKVFAAHLR
jgi:hypothetical protein